MIVRGGVKLDVGEPVLEITFRGRAPYLFTLSNGLRLHEVLEQNGRNYIVHDRTIYNNERLNFPVRTKVAEVYVISPSNMPSHPLVVAEVPPGKTIPEYSLVSADLEHWFKTGKFENCVNGLKVFGGAKSDEKQELRRGSEERPLVSTITTKGIVGYRYQLLRFIPATKENKKRLEDVFGPIF